MVASGWDTISIASSIRRLAADSVFVVQVWVNDSLIKLSHASI